MRALVLFASGRRARARGPGTARDRLGQQLRRARGRELWISRILIVDSSAKSAVSRLTWSDGSGSVDDYRAFDPTGLQQLVVPASGTMNLKGFP